ncbi:MAG: hypothetical protein V1917_01745 [Candidatus Gottesmanbacteria bacterium]
MTPLLQKTVSSKFTAIVSILALIAFIPLFFAVTYQSIRLITKASGTKAVIVVDTTATLEPINTDFYHAFAQGGEEPTNMIAPIVNETKALAPKLIRIDHIYDHHNVVSKNGGALFYDFSRLDQIVDTIRSTGATPFLSLSFMPSAIAKDGVIINPPNDWNDWTAVVKRTIEHYSGRGEKNISGMYYEVWNEPDLDQFGKWKLSGDKNYLTLYRTAAQGASQATNTNAFMFGGPSTTGLYKNWILGVVNTGARVDFFSWHSYLANPKQFTTDQHNLSNWLLPYSNYVTKPTIITEFGFTGAKSTNYGTAFGTAHTAAVIRELISGGPLYLFSFELIDGPSQENGGGWGLITHPTNGKKMKPRYYIYAFIDAMKGTRLQLHGEGSWVTGFASTKDNVFRVLLVNFDARGNHTEQTPVTLTRLQNGTYQYKELSASGRSIQTEELVTDGTLKKTVTMSAQSVVRIEVKKIK